MESLLSIFATLMGLWLELTMMTPAHAFTPTPQEACCLAFRESESTARASSACLGYVPTADTCDVILQRLSEAAQKAGRTPPSSSVPLSLPSPAPNPLPKPGAGGAALLVRNGVPTPLAVALVMVFLLSGLAVLPLMRAGAWVLALVADLLLCVSAAATAPGAILFLLIFQGSLGAARESLFLAVVGIASLGGLAAAALAHAITRRHRARGLRVYVAALALAHVLSLAGLFYH